ncbi:hypothetical protein CBS101457_002771 [Exobasidium rhododendri]|nr:hypothetical protein CBS101457_002771 [Exobasidium rhododendri]
MPSISIQARQAYGQVTSGLVHTSSSVDSATKAASSSLPQSSIIGVVAVILALVFFSVFSAWRSCARRAKLRGAAREHETKEAEDKVKEWVLSTSSVITVQEPAYVLPNIHSRAIDRRGSDSTLVSDDEWSVHYLGEAEDELQASQLHHQNNAIQNAGRHCPAQQNRIESINTYICETHLTPVAAYTR